MLTYIAIHYTTYFYLLWLVGPYSGPFQKNLILSLTSLFKDIFVNTVGLPVVWATPPDVLDHFTNPPLLILTLPKKLFIIYHQTRPTLDVHPQGLLLSDWPSCYDPAHIPVWVCAISGRVGWTSRELHNLWSCTTMIAEISSRCAMASRHCFFPTRVADEKVLLVVSNAHAIKSVRWTRLVQSRRQYH